MTPEGIRRGRAIVYNKPEQWVGRGGLESGFCRWLIFRSAPVNPNVRLESICNFQEWADHQLTKDVLADLTKIEERILAGSLAFDFQNDISNAESKLLEVGNVEACLLLSKLSLVHMIELGMTDSNDPKIARMLKEIPATRTQDFAPLLAKLIAEVRSGNSG